MIAGLMEKARKIVLKFGSNTLASMDGRINPAVLGEFAEQVAGLVRSGKQIIIVSSGAQAAGLSTMGEWARKKDIHYKQALCAVGHHPLKSTVHTSFGFSGITLFCIMLPPRRFLRRLTPVYPARTKRFSTLPLAGAYLPVWLRLYISRIFLPPMPDAISLSVIFPRLQVPVCCGCWLMVSSNVLQDLRTLLQETTCAICSRI